MMIRVSGEMLQNAFRKCSLYPWDASAVDYSKIENTCTVNQQRENQTTRELFPSQKLTKARHDVVSKDMTSNYCNLRALYFDGRII